MVVVICEWLAKVWRQMIRDRILLAVFEVWHWIVAIATGEFMLDKFCWKNGSAVIVARSIWGALLVAALRLVVINLVVLDKALFTFNIELARIQLGQSGTWIAGAFAGIYTALYAKFSSQWSYLAGVYNEIKRAECAKERDPDKVAEWKHGFIVDARALHLANNSVFKKVIAHWLQEPKVAELDSLPISATS